jgi:RNA polymerase sigma-70 factor (ECF subfamily)
MRPNTADQDDNSSPPAPSFHDLLLATLPSLRMQAMALTRHRADAEDLVQSAVMNALARSTPSSPAPISKPGWCASCATASSPISAPAVRRWTLDDAPSSMMGRSGGQEENLAFKELQKNLARLPADQRVILMMISVEASPTTRRPSSWAWQPAP